MVNITFYSSVASQQTVSFPSKWNDLSRSEAETVCSAIASDSTATALLVLLLEGRAKAQRVRLPVDWRQRVNAEDFTLYVLPLLDGLLAKPELTKQHYPTLRRSKGPADDFNDITVAEYEQCEHYAGYYQRDPKRDYILEIIRVLWRPTVWGRRRAYNTEGRLRTASFFAKLPDATLHTIYLWYTSCRASLPLLFPAAFGVGGPSGAPDPMALTNLIHTSAGDKNGQRPQVRQTSLKEFLFECNRCALEQERIEEMHSKNQ